MSALILAETADRIDVVNVPPIPLGFDTSGEMTGTIVEVEKYREILALILALKLAPMLMALVVLFDEEIVAVEAVVDNARGSRIRAGYSPLFDCRESCLSRAIFWLADGDVIAFGRSLLALLVSSTGKAWLIASTIMKVSTKRILRNE